MNIVVALAIFVAYFVADMLYANFVRFVNAGHAIKAATCSAAIALLMTMGIMQCIDNNFYLLPLLTGAWLGTYVAVLPVRPAKPNHSPVPRTY